MSYKADRTAVVGYNRTVAGKARKSVDELYKSDIIKVTRNAVGKEVTVVSKTKVTGIPNSITQKENAKGEIERNYYDENGRQFKQIANNHHGKPAKHPYGKNGEHAHDYYIDDKGIPKHGKPRELTDDERKENSDIL